jgi:hypothetical protein
VTAWAIDRAGRSLIDLLGTIQHLARASMPGCNEPGQPARCSAALGRPRDRGRNPAIARKRRRNPGDGAGDERRPWDGAKGQRRARRSQRNSGRVSPRLLGAIAPGHRRRGHSRWIEVK